MFAMEKCPPSESTEETVPDSWTTCACWFEAELRELAICEVWVLEPPIEEGCGSSYATTPTMMINTRTMATQTPLFVAIHYGLSGR
jgi:hypothetical protein